MKEKKHILYLRAYRMRWGLSQKDVAELMGWRSDTVVSKLEKKQRPPTARVLIGCFIIFGTPAIELFPGLFSEVETEVMKRVWDMYERIQGHPSKRTRTKIELLEDVIDRAEKREHDQHV
jgi:transcriptional regulator with XRE-family HTH domain